MGRETERAWSLFVVASSTLWLMVIISHTPQYHNRRKNLIVICHPLLVKQLLLNSSYVLSSAVKRSSFFSWSAECISVWTQLHAKVTPSKMFPSAVSIMAKPSILQSTLTILLDIFKMLDSWRLNSLWWAGFEGECFVEYFGLPPPLCHAVVWAP